MFKLETDKQSPDTLAIGVLVMTLLTLIAFARWAGKEAQSSALGPAEISATNTAPRQEPRARLSSPAIPLSFPATVPEGQLTAKDHGFQDAPLALLKDGAMLYVKLGWKETYCGLHNRERIKGELSSSNTRAKLYLAVEALDPLDRAFEPQVVELKPEHFFSGASYSLPIPYTGEPRHLGLFICRGLASAKPGCVQAAKGGGGKLYYFSYVLLQGRRLYVPGYFFDQQRYLEFGKLLSDLHPRRQATVKAVFKKVRLLDRALKPSRPDLEGPVIDIKLPLGGPEQC
jgi:hypothetical protein